MKYSSEITGFGPEAFEFLEPELALNFVIIFNEDAPPELAELAILHTKADLIAPPAKGDILMIGENVYTITAVGDEAPQTLAELGHCTLAFGGGDEAFRPGCIMLEGEMIKKDSLKVGDRIEIY
ncbi:MAG: PTS glucitol/sorbitol transporter subunit IIA [Eubacterium sp.]|nr:PTS glucitol/sorbitol transporter subunit IIA [Eubacterium sp.]